MSSPYKSPKKNLPPIIGYVHDLSRIRQGPKRKWFDMKLQTNDQKRKRAVCFSKEKYSMFAEKQNTITPAKITNYVTSTSLDGNEEEILINDMSVIQTPSASEYSFQYEKNESANMITPINIIVNETKSCSFLNTEGKLTKGLKEEIVGKNSAKMLKCAITDKTDSIAIVIWEEEIEEIQHGNVYRFSGVGVRYREQMKYLTTTRAATITKIENDELKELDDSRAVELLQLSSDKKVQVEQIRSVNIEVFKSCVQCLAKIPPALQTSIVKCPRCGDRMRVEDCKGKIAAKLKILVESDAAHTVTVFSEELEKFFGEDISTFTPDEMGEKLLFEKKIIISFNNEDIVSLIERQ